MNPPRRRHRTAYGRQPGQGWVVVAAGPIQGRRAVVDGEAQRFGAGTPGFGLRTHWFPGNEAAHRRVAGLAVRPPAGAARRRSGYRCLDPFLAGARGRKRSEEHTSELQSLMRISYAVFCLKKKTKANHNTS